MYTFTEDWFSIAIPSWKKFIVPALKDKPSIMLEIGSFQGMSALWSLKHFLNHPKSKVICCDLYEDFEGYKGSDLLNTFKTNTKEYQDKIILCRGKSQESLKKPAFWKHLHEKVDFGYIDGGHSSKEALEDAILLWPLIKPNGFLCFDDYFGGEIESIKACHIGINAFLQIYANEFDILHQGYQIILRKRIKVYQEQ